MRAWTIALFVSCCALLAACGSQATTFQPRPGEHFSVMQTPNPGGSLSDLASQITTDTLLGHRGAKMEKAQPFPPCPGEAGLQIFTLPGSAPALLRVAFTQWNGTEKIASYQRPVKSPDDPSAIDALRKAVCTSPLG